MSGRPSTACKVDWTLGLKPGVITQYLSLVNREKEIVVRSVSVVYNNLYDTIVVVLFTYRICANGQSFDPSPATGNDVRRCVTQCMRPPVCGTVTIPDAHLKVCDVFEGNWVLTLQYCFVFYTQRCVECNGAESQCQLGDPSENGVGVRDTDYILYISATPCGGGQTLAFAAACQIESQEERPIAGYINFCSNNLASTTRDFLFRVAQHEIFHALGFSSSLMTRWRDSAGNPRVPEGQ